MSFYLLDFDKMERATNAALTAIAALAVEMPDMHIGKAEAFSKPLIDTLAVYKTGVFHCPCCEHRLVVGYTETAIEGSPQ